MSARVIDAAMQAARDAVADRPYRGDPSYEDVVAMIGAALRSVSNPLPEEPAEPETPAEPQGAATDDSTAASDVA